VLSSVVVTAMVTAAVGSARAQDGGEPTERVRLVRPPAGSIERGSIQVPEWVVLTGGIAVALAAAAALAARARRARNAARRGGASALRQRR